MSVYYFNLVFISILVYICESASNQQQIATEYRPILVRQPPTWTIPRQDRFGRSILFLSPKNGDNNQIDEPDSSSSNSQPPSYPNQVVFSSKEEILKSLEDEVEMHTNNHQSVMHESNNPYNPLNVHNSRHYSNQYPYSSILYNNNNNNKKHLHPSGDGYNLNYMHGFSSKPSSNSLSNLLPSGAPSYGAGSSYSSALYSMASALNSINSLGLPSKQQLSGDSSDLMSNQQTSSCGRQQVSFREPRIVGGNTTYEGEFPWAVSIQRYGNHHCGGVIVGRRWILTAAHCVRSQHVTNLLVRTGGHTLSRSANGINSHLERDYLVDQIVMHDDFSRFDNLTASQTKSSANTNNADIALLRLKHEILWNEMAWPVCFPSREAGNFSGLDAVVIGWGKLNEKSEEFSNELQKVKLTIIDNKVCQNWFRQAGRDMPIDDRIICAGFKSGGKDACHGDSGGPLLSKINGHYVVVGVVSTGIGCARPLLPGLYSRVSSYINWIEKYVSSTN